MGKTFDELPVDSADFSCIDQNVVKKFLKIGYYLLFGAYQQVTFYKNIKSKTVTTPVTTPTTTPATTPTTPEEKVLSCISKNNRISKQEIGDILGITRDGVSYHIKNYEKRV